MTTQNAISKPAISGPPRAMGGAPPGQDARLVADLARAGARGHLHVAVDDAGLARLADGVRFFAPDLTLIELPAWDCLPYDRVSPHPDIVAGRAAALARLAGGVAPGTLVLTTVAAALQRVPPRACYLQSFPELRPGSRLDQAALTGFLAENGYARADTVREPGEYALRGSLIDLFPPGAEQPVRIDLFGDEVESIRSFDALDQRTTGQLESVSFRPVSELFLDRASIDRFRAGYRGLFGPARDDDPLYEAVSAGRRHAGMEHWLPLFHGRMELLTDYLPGAGLTLDYQLAEAAAARLEQVAEFFAARQDMAEAKVRGAVYHPLPPDRLYVGADEWQRLLGERQALGLSPFAPPPGGADAGGRKGRDFADIRAQPDANLFDAVDGHVESLLRDGKRVLVAAYSKGARERLRQVFAEHGLARLTAVEDWAGLLSLPAGVPAVGVLPLESGFVATDLAVITEQDMLGDRLARPRRKARAEADMLVELSALAPGDLVVHLDHGIGRFEGLETLQVAGVAHDVLKLVYDGGDRLYIPVENIEVLSRFGAEEAAVALDRLGGAGWQARKARVKKRLKDMAEALMKVAAARELKRTDSLAAPEGATQEFAARFPWTETDDQARAITAVQEDLASGRAMDRLVCGDVGFGKTEVALRAAFAAAMSGAQVAVVVPTTLLARQHARTFAERFRGLPVRIGHLSRLVPAREAAQTKEELTRGECDIVIGTHALLGKGIRFSRLGLLIIDEEQRFGVKQKERLKQLKEDVHVLTLTATPIPRTLQLALAGVKELSMIASPPVDRLAVRSFVLPWDPVVVREALMREHFRGGQSFYVCPRVSDIPGIEETLKELVPELKTITAHGQLSATELEDRMERFLDGAADILIATNIIESGLDIPSANTLVVHRADMFGLAQLYQIRGRVGRSRLRAYAYMTHAPDQALNPVAQKRLEVLGTLDALGSGFQLASHDLDIRGAGNLLGEEQSGHIREVGIELYQEMLREAVDAARHGLANEPVAEGWSPQINLGIPVMIPEAYVTDLNLRLGLYRRLASLADRAELDSFAAELIDRFGAMPAEVENLMEIMAIKQQCRAAHVDRLDSGPKGIVLGFRGDRFPHVDRLVAWIAGKAGTVKLRPDQKLVFAMGWQEQDKRVGAVRGLLNDLAALAA